MSFRGIFDHPKSMDRGDPVDRVHVCGMAIQMNHNDTFRSLCDALLKQLWIHAPGVSIHIHKDRLGTHISDSVRRRDVGKRWHEDLITRSNIKTEHGKVKCDRPITHGKDTFGLAHRGEVRLEPLYVGPSRRNPRAP